MAERRWRRRVARSALCAGVERRESDVARHDRPDALVDGLSEHTAALFAPFARTQRIDARANMLIAVVETIAGEVLCRGDEAVLLHPGDQAAREASDAFRLVAEATRIEHKFSRYRNDNPIYQINHSADEFVELDDETERLIAFAFECYALSEGLFDITSGILRKIWRFDGKHSIPTQKQVDEILPFIGLNRVIHENRRLKLPAGMQIDLGGIGKEYAVDRIAGLLRDQYEPAILVNLGGDIAITGERANKDPWRIGIVDPNHSQQASSSLKIGRAAKWLSILAVRFFLLIKTFAVMRRNNRRG